MLPGCMYTPWSSRGGDFNNGIKLSVATRFAVLAKKKKNLICNSLSKTNFLVLCFQKSWPRKLSRRILLLFIKKCNPIITVGNPSIKRKGS